MSPSPLCLFSATLAITVATPASPFPFFTQDEFAVFTATGPDTGTLSDVEAGMEYQIGHGSWIKITDIKPIDLTGLGACTISVVKKGNGTTPSDSTPQTITVTKSTVPTAIKTDCITSANNDGTITGVTTAMEYNTDSSTWTAITGNTITSLTLGTYLVRVKVAGTALASEPQTLTIAAFSSTGKK